jgi:5-methylcytosine-specific restriction endonuclease McrA
MVQLSFLGEPAEPKEPNGRRRLQMLIHEAVAPHLAHLGLARHAIDETADLIVDHLSRRRLAADHRTMLMRLYGDEPACWVCEAPILKHAPADSDGAFSIDHVVPRSHGGARLGLSNLRPAHRLCNSVRSSPKLSLRTRARYEAFLATTHSPT